MKWSWSQEIIQICFASVVSSLVVLALGFDEDAKEMR